jgi:hypothetical protein
MAENKSVSVMRKGLPKKKKEFQSAPLDQNKLAQTANPHPTNVLQTKKFKGPPPPLPPKWDEEEEEVEFELELEFDEDVELVPSEDADVPKGELASEPAKLTDGSFDTVCHVAEFVDDDGS